MLSGALLLPPGSLCSVVRAAPADSQTVAGQTALAPALSAADRAVYIRLLKAAHQGQPLPAIRPAHPHPELDLVLRWQMLLHAPALDPADALRFIAAHGDFPALGTLQRRAEDALPENAPPSLLHSWFDGDRPQTIHGDMLLLALQRSEGRPEQASATARRLWLNPALTPEQLAAVEAQAGDFLTAADQLARLNRLLNDRQTAAIAAQAERVDPESRAVALARLALIQGSSTAPALVDTLPEARRNEPGVVLDRIRYYRLRDDPATAIALLEAAPLPPAERQDSWWSERSRLARTVLDQGQNDVAYRLLAAHGLSDGNGFSEAEMLAGWVALRRLNRPELAIAHFRRLGEKASLPATRSRALFWQALALDTGGQTAEARTVLLQAAAASPGFYGQQARLRLDPAARFAVSEPATPAASDSSRFQAQRFVMLARLLGADLKLPALARPFLQKLADAARSPADRLLVARLARDCDVPEVAVSTAKRAERDGQQLGSVGYPSPVLPALPAGSKSDAPEPAVSLGVIRQESQFQADVVSPVGARGLMQLMPATARMVATQLKLSKTPADSALTDDPALNMQLGQQYLSGLLQQYTGSVVLAAAAYNAGPHRVNQWLKDHGDPRPGGTVDPLDWIELIPFSETRLYVQKVIENARLYRSLPGLAGTAASAADFL